MWRSKSSHFREKLGFCAHKGLWASRWGEGGGFTERLCPSPSSALPVSVVGAPSASSWGNPPPPPGRCSIGSCRSGMFVEGAEFRILLCHHLEREPPQKDFLRCSTAVVSFNKRGNRPKVGQKVIDQRGSS